MIIAVLGVQGEKAKPRNLCLIDVIVADEPFDEMLYVDGQCVQGHARTFSLLAFGAGMRAECRRSRWTHFSNPFGKQRVLPPITVEGWKNLAVMAGSSESARCFFKRFSRGRHLGSTESQARQFLKERLEVRAQNQRATSRFSGTETAITNRRVDVVAAHVGVNGCFRDAVGNFFRTLHGFLRQRSTAKEFTRRETSAQVAL
jgi:hypothetical protein